MKDKKIIVYVIAALLLIFLCLAVLGVLNKKPSNNNGNTDNTKVETMNVTEGTSEVALFTTIVEQQEFVKANKEDTNGVFSATYEEKLVITFIDQEGTNDVVKEVTGITNVKALSGFTDKDGNLRLYVLTEDGAFYLVEASKTTGPKVTKYNLENIESFKALYGDLKGEDTAQLFVVIKTTDGKYYTDYMFDDGKRELKNVDNATSGVDEPEPFEDQPIEGSETPEVIVGEEE